MKRNRKRSSVQRMLRPAIKFQRIVWLSFLSKLILTVRYGIMMQFVIFRGAAFRQYQLQRSFRIFQKEYMKKTTGGIWSCCLLEQHSNVNNNQKRRVGVGFTTVSLERRNFCSIINHDKDSNTSIDTDKINSDSLDIDPPTIIENTTNEINLSSIDTTVSRRRSILRQKLLLLDCFTEDDVLEFESIVKQFTMDPTASSSTLLHKFGKSTIKTCQTFYYPKNEENVRRNNDLEWIHIAATRTARQIEFLYLRHKAQQTQWIRNHDNPFPRAAKHDDSTPIVQNTDAIHPQQQSTRSNHYPFIVVLDNLRSAQNVGSIYRTADATKCQQVITIGITPNPVNGNGMNKIHKSALGAELLVPSLHFHNASSALQFMQQEYPNYQLLLVETTSRSVLYTDYQYTVSSSEYEGKGKHGIILVFGNEVTGVDVSFYLNNKEYDNRTSVVEIPMYGQKNSLNVAVCVSILLYEMIRQFNLMANVTSSNYIDEISKEVTK